MEVSGSVASTARTVVFGLFAIVVVRFLYQIIYYRYFHPLANFPGPFWGSVTRLWMAYHNLFSTEIDAEIKLHKKYGNVLRVSPTMLLVSDCTKLPEIYHRRSSKSDYYVSAGFGEAESVFNMKDHKVHASFRKLIAGPYSVTNMKKLEPLMDARMEEWVNELTERFAKPQKRFDFAPWAVYLAFDIISEIGFGAPLGFCKAGNDVGGLIESFHQGMTVFGLLGRLHPFTNAFKETWLGRKILVAKPEDQHGVGALMRTRDSLIAQRLEDIKAGKAADRVDLLQYFLDARGPDGKPLDMEYIKAEVLLVLLAGADTSGTAFQGMMCYVMSNPAIYSKMMEELDDATRRGQLSASPQYDEVMEHCPYYVACLRETLRLFPSAPNIFPRVVDEPGLVFNGKLAPPGTEVTCNPMLANRDKYFYGPDADEFHPERWLKDPEKSGEYQKYSFTFGYGSRICLGKDLAMIELCKGPLQFFREFTPELVNKEVPGEFLVVGGVGYWKNVEINITKRPPVTVSS